MSILQSRAMTIALLCMATVLAVIMTGWSVRTYVCGGAPIANHPTLLFCPESVKEMVEAETVYRAEKALREKAFDEFAAIVRSKGGGTALQDLMPAAIASGDVGSVKLLISRGARPDRPAPSRHYRGDYGGGSGLVIAADQGDRAMMEFLLGHRANIDGAAPDRADTSPLGIAAREGNVELVKYLLSKGARPDGNLSNTALAEGKKRPMPVVMVGENYVTPFYQAIHCLTYPQMASLHRNTKDCRRVAVILIERGATIVGGSDIGEVIHRTSGEEREKAVSLLLAIAAHNGRWDDMVARLMEATGPLWVQPGLAHPNPDADFQPYVSSAARCGPQHMVAKDDHYTFCQGTTDRL